MTVQPTMRMRVNKILEMLRGATLTPEEGKLIIGMARLAALREELEGLTKPPKPKVYPDTYLLNVGQDLMPESAYIEWAREHLAKLDS